ncbi:molybdopterin-dependent oxidoreductase [Capilliphycus salinus ALCB114379]|uniref:molybdopterin-dependent oxidoreductase n=1 Tax=Capilliphycus salinus TaxID=2768948 RepID=UPI0039A6EF70
MELLVNALNIGSPSPDGKTYLLTENPDIFYLTPGFLNSYPGGISGLSDPDLIVGSVSNERILGDIGSDTLMGGEGDDSLIAGKNYDLLYGNQGDDILGGEQGQDTLYGGQGNDVIQGQEADDYLSGDLGIDTLVGGEGADVFILRQSTGVTELAEADIIADFEAVDRIGLAEGLSLTNLNLETNGEDTIIRDTISNTILARVVGVSTEALTGRFLDLTPPEIIVDLENDTGIGTEDNFSADPTLIGRVNNASEIVNFRASFSDTMTSNFVDISAELEPDGSFRLTPENLAEINGETLPDGLYTLRLFASDEFGNTTTEEFDFTFAVETLFFISGEIPQTEGFSAGDLAQLPRLTIETSDRGTPAIYEGVPLIEVLREAEVPLGDQLRGDNMTLYLVVEAADGYQVVYSLTELDPTFGNRTILLADTRDGQPLSGDEGPLRLVIPGDQRQARWIRQITQMKLLTAS